MPSSRSGGRSSDVLHLGYSEQNRMFYSFAELLIGGTFSILTKSDNSLETVDATHLLDLIALRRGSVYFRVCANTAVAYTNGSSGGDCDAMRVDSSPRCE